MTAHDDESLTVYGVPLRVWTDNPSVRMWRGKDPDLGTLWVECAEEYAAEMRREDPPRFARVFVYEASERDPLGRARREVVDATSARSGR